MRDAAAAEGRLRGLRVKAAKGYLNAPRAGTVKVSGMSNVTAEFTRKTFTVTIEKAGDGDGTVSSDGPLACGTVIAHFK